MPPCETATSLARPVASIGGGTLVSRLLGFARDMLIARLFGATQATDAFFVAFRIPNLMRRLFAEGAFAATLVPLLTRAGAADARDPRTRELIGEFLGSLSALLLMLTGLGLLASPVLVFLLAPGFGPETPRQELATALVRLTLPYLFFVGLTALAGAILNRFEHFAIPAFTPALLNLALIGCALGLAPRLAQPVFALAIGVLIGGAAQLAVQLAALARIGLLVVPRVNLKNPELRRLLSALGPTLIGMSITQINLLLDTLLASFLIAGSISWLYYAERLMDFPLGILGAALGTAILPRLARTHHAGDAHGFNTTLDWGLRWMVLLGLPATLGLLILSEPIIIALFLSERFNPADAAQSGQALMAYALGLPFFMAHKVMTPGFFSREQLRAPLRIGLISIAINLILSLLLMGPLGHTGLALGTSIAAALAATLLLRVLMAEDDARFAPGWTALLARVVLATTAMGLLIAQLATRVDWLAVAAPQRLVIIAGIIVGGALAYLGSLLALGLRPRHLQPGGRDPHHRR